MDTKSPVARDHLSVDELTEEYPVSRAWVYREVRV